MTDFRITFEYPWLLFLLIPALFLAFFPYFRTQKRYRRNRNRITSLVLHTIVMVLSVLVLSGINFTYQIPNTENEILLLVDLSRSSEQSKEQKDLFVEEVIAQCGSGIKLGVVTFGLDQVYAAPLSEDIEGLYSHYSKAELPNDSATDIASALEFAKNQLNSPQTAKIVLISDGLETDGSAMRVVRTLTAQGIHLDTVHFPSQREGDEVQVSSIETPDYNLSINEKFNVSVTLTSSMTGNVNLTLYDNGAASGPTTVNLVGGTQTVAIEHEFAEFGLHELCVRIETPEGDTLEQNNVYYTYIYLENFEKVMILEGFEDEGKALEELLSDQQSIDTKSYKVERFYVGASNVPKTLAELRQYDEIILVNISNGDLKLHMPDGFDKILELYVSEVGGGLFTVGGKEPDSTNDAPVAHAYNRDDLNPPPAEGMPVRMPTTLQEMLPVQAIEYTPPAAVVIIIDRSGSMGPSAGGDMSKLDLAKEGALACLHALSERDYCGVISLDTVASEEVQLLPRTQEAKIEAAIASIEIGGGTIYTPSIEAAAKTLNLQRDVEKRHIILVSDGQPGDSFAEFGPRIQYYMNLGITFSVFSLGNPNAEMARISELAADGVLGFYTYENPTDPVNGISQIVRQMREVLNDESIKNVTYGEFQPTIRSYASVMSGIMQDDMPKLKGFFGTKAKDEATVVLTHPTSYVPIYAQWDYGKGRVGSFMCDLSGGDWSGDFMKNEFGERFICNVVNALFPTENIRPRDIDLELEQDNYTTSMNIFADLDESETLELTIRRRGTEFRDGEEVVSKMVWSASDAYSRYSFQTLRAGIYEITLQKKDADENVIVGSEYRTYVSFSYSKEFDAFIDRTGCAEFMRTLAERGNGALLETEEAGKIFEDFSRGMQKTYNPTLVFMIIALVLFLLDVAVRKFKFKWPHEIVQAWKEKKASKND